jgi:hypothetical protein
MTRILSLALTCVAMLSVTQPAAAWSENNCKSLCNATSNNPAACYQNIPCSKYRGQREDTNAIVKAKARAFMAGRQQPFRPGN